MCALRSFTCHFTTAGHQGNQAKSPVVLFKAELRQDSFRLSTPSSQWEGKRI